MVAFKGKLKSSLVDPKRFHKDLENFHLSKYLINELREFYTVIERSSFYNNRSGVCKPRMTCKKSWPICYLALEKYKDKHEPQILLLRSQFVLSNFKHNHFAKKDKSKLEPLAVVNEKAHAQKVLEDDILMERQTHVCECFDTEFDRMKSEVKIRISKQVANLVAKRTTMVDRKNSQEANQAYDDFMKKRRVTELSSQPDVSDYSESMGSKPSHDIHNFNNYNNTRSLA